MKTTVASVFSVVMLFVAIPIQAQMAGAPTAGYKREPGMASSRCRRRCARSASTRTSISALPLDATFRDERGRTVRLGDYFGTKPVVLAFVYYDCPMLCTQVINGLTSALGVLSLDAGQGLRGRHRQLRPARDAGAGGREEGRCTSQRYKRAGAADGWHFLTGDQPSIERLTKAAGFRYVWDEETKQFAHPTGIIVADARRPARAVSLRHRVRPARPAAGAGRGVGRQGRLRRSTRCCSTAITTTR